MYGGQQAANGPYLRRHLGVGRRARRLEREDAGAERHRRHEPGAAHAAADGLRHRPARRRSCSRLAAAGRLLHPRSVGVGRRTDLDRARGHRRRSRTRATARRWSGTRTAIARSCSAASARPRPARGPLQRHLGVGRHGRRHLDRPDARRARSRRRACTTRRSTTRAARRWSCSAATPAPARPPRAPGSTRPGSGTARAPPASGRR